MTDINIKIFYLIESNKITEAKNLFRMNINTPDQMYNIVLEAFNLNKDTVGKEIINFKFAMKNRGFQYDFSPFDFFCYVCKNEHMDILFRIIEDEYFWNKDKVIFESNIDQTPKQWLIATAGYIYCSLNKIKSLDLICNKYNITTFDAVQSHFFDTARSNNYNELIQYLINRYKHYTQINKINKDRDNNEIYESSLYNFNKENSNGLYHIIKNDRDIIYQPPQNKSNDKIIDGIDNPMYDIK
jgi:hypothetical protein